MSLLSDLRGFAQMLGWYRRGMPIPPVPAVKRRLLRHYAEKHGLKLFIETGTFKGDTLAAMVDAGMRGVSIELGDDLFARAQQRFAKRGDVTLHHGDSGSVLPPLVAALQEPALFWLDGHYSEGSTAHGALASPISAEVQAVLDSPVMGHVILIDDAHEFAGQGGYPELGHFLTRISAEQRFRAFVHTNIIVIEPKA